MWSMRDFFMMGLLIIIIIALAVYVIGYVYLAKKITREKYEASWPDVGLESSPSSPQERPRPPSEVISRMEKELDELKMIKSMLISETETRLVEQTQKGIESTKQDLLESTRTGIREDTQKIIQEKVQKELRNLEAVKEKLGASPSGRATMSVDRVYAPFDAYNTGMVSGGRMVVISRETPDPSAFSSSFSSRLRDHFSSSRDAWRDTPFGYYVFMDKDVSMTYRVDVPRSGRYTIDLFVYARQGNTDSFYMAMDGGSRQWWDLRGWSSSQFGFMTWKTVDWDQGAHTVTVSGREPTGFAAIRIRSSGTNGSENLPKSSGLSRRVILTPGKAVPPLATYNEGLVEQGDYLVIDKENPDPTRFTSSFDSRLSYFSSKKDAWGDTPFGYYVFMSTDTKFSYVFDAPSDGEYDIELFVIAEQGNTDSFYMEVDGGGREWWDIPEWKSNGMGYMRWKRQYWSRGQHKLTVHGREPTGLAAVRISSV